MMIKEVLYIGKKDENPESEEELNNTQNHPKD